MGANNDAGLGRLFAGAADDAGVASMESARNVGTGDGLEHGFVIAECPAPEGLADVAVQIDDCHDVIPAS